MSTTSHLVPRFRPALRRSSLAALLLSVVAPCATAVDLRFNDFELTGSSTTTFSGTLPGSPVPFGLVSQPGANTPQLQAQTAVLFPTAGITPSLSSAINALPQFENRMLWNLSGRANAGLTLTVGSGPSAVTEAVTTGTAPVAIGAALTGLPAGGTLSFSGGLALLDDWFVDRPSGNGTDDASTFLQLRLNGVAAVTLAVADQQSATPTLVVIRGNPFDPASETALVTTPLLAGVNFGSNANLKDSAWDLGAIAALQNLSYTPGPGGALTYEFVAGCALGDAYAEGASSCYLGRGSQSYLFDNFLVRWSPASQVPLPATAALIGVGLIAAAGLRRRRG